MQAARPIVHMPAVHRVYELVHRFLFNGMSHPHAPPRRYMEKPAKKTQVTFLSVSSIDRISFPMTIPTTPGTIAGNVLINPSGSQVSCQKSPGTTTRSSQAVTFTPGS